jgi:PIN domain nuclease of toxin-antitoxin system
MKVVLDASAVIAFLKGEPGAEVVEGYFRPEMHSLYMHALNMCEVYYDFLRAAGEASAESAV